MKKLLTLSLLFIGMSAYAQKAKLELNLQKDSTYSLSIDADMDIDQLINGTHQIVKSNITGTTAHKVTAIKDTLYEMEVTYKKLGMRMEVGDRVIEFNTDGGGDDIGSKVMRTIINKPFGMVMNKRGQVVGVKNVDSLFLRMATEIKQLTEAQVAQFMAQMKQAFGEKTIKNNMQEAFVMFPKAPVALKGTWTTVNAMEAAAISLKTKTTYTLNAITELYYDVSGSAIITPDKVPPFKQSNGYYIRLTQAAGNYTAKMKIDKVTGWVAESHVGKAISATIQAKKTLAGPVELSYPMKLSLKYTVSDK